MKLYGVNYRFHAVLPLSFNNKAEPPIVTQITELKMIFN